MKSTSCSPQLFRPKAVRPHASVSPFPKRQPSIDIRQRLVPNMYNHSSSSEKPSIHSSRSVPSCLLALANFKEREDDESKGLRELLFVKADLECRYRNKSYRRSHFFKETTENATAVEEDVDAPKRPKNPMTRDSFFTEKVDDSNKCVMDFVGKSGKDGVTSVDEE